MNQTPSLDPVAVAVVLLAYVFSRELAAVIAPYAVIIIASFTGAGWALSRRDPTLRGNSFAFFGRLIGTAIFITASLASISHHYFGVQDPQLLFAPIALIVGGIGDDWPNVGRWALGLLGRVVEIVSVKKGSE